jgi:hypothetical protein
LLKLLERDLEDDLVDLVLELDLDFDLDGDLDLLLLVEEGVFSPGDRLLLLRVEV